MLNKNEIRNKVKMWLEKNSKFNITMKDFCISNGFTVKTSDNTYIGYIISVERKDMMILYKKNRAVIAACAYEYIEFISMRNKLGCEVNISLKCI